MKKVKLPVNFVNYNFSNLAKKEKNAALKIRYLAFSHIAAGKTVVETATIVLKSARMLHRWLNRFAEFDIEGLKDKNGRGRTLYLPLEKEAEFKNVVASFLKETNKIKITGHDIQQLLKSKYSISCTLLTAYSILTRLKLKVKVTKQKSKLKMYFQQRHNIINSLIK